MSSYSKLFRASAKEQNYGGKLSLKDNIRALKYLPPFLKLIWDTQPWMAAGNMILRLFKAGIPVSTLYLGKLIIDEVILLSQTAGADKSYLWMLIAAEFGLALFSSLLGRAISLLDALLGDLFSNESSVRLIAHAASLDLPQFEDSVFYDKLERARQQTNSRTILMSQMLLQAQDMISMAFLAAGLTIFNPWLILLLVITVIPAFISETHFNQRSYSLSRAWTPERRELDYVRYIGASDQTVKEVKIFGLADFLKGRFQQLAHRYYLANKVLAIRRAVWGFVFNSLGDLGYYGAYVMIALQAIGGQISLGDLIFLSGSFSRLSALLQGILSRFSTIAQSALYLQDFFDFFAMKPAIFSPADPLPFPSAIQEGFVFENVSFKYPNSPQYALRNASFTLKAGEKIALVGENGAGKTTLVKLMARLYDPTEGRILLDGHDLRHYDLDQLRQAIGVIFQDYVRYSLTVGENIAVGQITDLDNKARIEEAARKSMADTVVKTLAGGYDQMLGRKFDKGVELSGGQWQKVALGRAYMREAQVLILDEPTAALDARAEYDVFVRFSELTQGKTAILISHRFSTVRMADRILVLENGGIRESGSHEELLALGGIYAELFELQAQGYR
ncbi:MAG: ABC transporter ATP-binding protein [Bacteroidia bacterium]|nr:ABC transporter ATP-binding protein [Bacteroidia bacterium]